MTDGKTTNNDPALGLLPGMIDRRDRMDLPFCEDEPSLPGTRRYQRVIDHGYRLLNQQKEYEKKEKEHKEGQRRRKPKKPPLPTLYQQVRIEHLIGKYYQSQNMLIEAAEHFRRAAELAKQIPDLALYAQLKLMESHACANDDHNRQFYRAFEAASDAWDAWRKLPARNLTDDIHFAFELADTLGISAVRVAEFQAAVDSMVQASILLLKLQGRPDVRADQYTNDDLFLHWDWATVSMGIGDYRQAFRRIVQTRNRGRDLLKPINRARLERLIAVIAMGCAEQGGIEEHLIGRLLVIADKAITAAYVELRQPDVDDPGGMMLTLLAEAKLQGMLKRPDKRVENIKKAEVIAATLNDPVASGQVDLAWGDEYAFQGKRREAKVFYHKVDKEMTEVGFLELALIAQQRLDRLH